MNVLGWVTVGLSAVWLITEFGVSARRRSRRYSAANDRLSLLAMRAATVVSIGFTVTAEYVPVLEGGAGKLLAVHPFLGYLGCLLIAGGLVIRLTAIAALDKQFTVDVSIVEGHRIVDTGWYRLVRHPAYLGSLLSFLGLGLALENLISLTILFTLPLASTLYRISVEERMLREHFGEAYEAYRRKTKSLIPGIV